MSLANMRKRDTPSRSSDCTVPRVPIAIANDRNGGMDDVNITRCAAKCLVVVTAVLLFFTQMYENVYLGSLLATDFVEKPLPQPTSNRTRDSVNTSDASIYLPDYLRNQQSISYSWTKSMPTRPLKFLHIPKTGGSSTAHAATRANLSWGYCMFRRSGGNVKCLKHANRPAIRNRPAPPWHTPLQYLPVNFSGSVRYRPNITNPYENSDIFVLVRNPYKREVSDYYFFAKTRGYFKSNHMNDTAASMNAKIQQKLAPLQAIERPKVGEMPPKPYFAFDGHCIPQSDYIFNTNSEAGEQLVHHIVHFENLKEEFPSLMDAYGLAVNLSASPHIQDFSKQLRPQCTVADLTAETRELIEAVYAQDFELGGYVMIEKALKQQSLNEIS